MTLTKSERAENTSTASEFINKKHQFIMVIAKYGKSTYKLMF